MLVQQVERVPLFRSVRHQLNDRVLLVVLRVQLTVDRRHALRRRNHGVFVHRDVRVRLTLGLRSRHFGGDLLANGLKGIRVGGGQVILDFNGVAGVNQLLQAQFVLVGQLLVLLFLEQAFDLRVHAVQRGDVPGQLIGYRSVPTLIGGILEALQLSPRGFRHGFPGRRPSSDHVVGFLLAVRPQTDDPVHPRLRALRIALEVAFRHTEEGKTVALAIEGLGGGILPAFRGFFHAL